MIADPGEARRLAFTGAVLVAGNLALLSPIRLGLERLYPGRNVFFARWGFLDLAGAILTGVLAAIALGALPLARLPQPLDDLGAALLVWLVLAAYLWRVARRSEPDARASLGLERSHAGRSIVAGLYLYLALLPAVAGALLCSPALVRAFGGTFEFQPILAELLAADGGVRVAAFVLVVVVLPFLEELFFRGFVQPLFVQNLREVGGIGLTSLLFAALHGASALPVVFALSCVLGVLRLRTMRLWAPFVVHAVHNALVVGVHLCWPEIREAF